ncbi:MAG: histidine kinase [Chitinophagaceae bacterium]|nr:histidine kinase [Chitinophagaceae bacterium]
MMRLYLLLLLIWFGGSSKLISGQIPSPVLEWTFNQGNYAESKGRIVAKPVGVKLVRDRFGNKKSSLYMEGSAYSYLNLGNSPLLKQPEMSISLWANVDREVYAGWGYESNVILTTRNSPVDDYCDAYTFIYDFSTNRIGFYASKDSTQQAGCNSEEELELNTWHHYVISFDDQRILFYMDGVLQGQHVKNFRTQYYAPDSVLIGYSGSKKNNRYMRGMVDDVRFYHHVLSQDEVLELYEEADPNKWRIWLKRLMALLGVVALSAGLGFIGIRRRRLALKKAEEQLILENSFRALEARSLKAQMNPHFIFNALNAIQQLIMQQQNDAAQHYLSRFSKLLRKLLESNQADSIRLSDEIDLLNRYLEIEALRFGQRFYYEVSVADTLQAAEVHIPQMLVQPFAENAVWHGLLPKPGDKSLKINFSLLDARRLCCVVEDNGIGRAASSAREQTFKRKSLALSFVKSRMELMSQVLQVACTVNIQDLYNDEGMAIGTRVVLHIPILELSETDASSENINSAPYLGDKASAP